MDPVSHVVLGRAVVAAFDRNTGSRFGPGVSAAAIAGALVPDIDAVLMPAGWDIYLRFHQIGTHSVAGALAAACGAGFVMRALVRTSRSWALAAAACLAALSHLLLDVLSGGALALAWPLSRMRMSLPLVAMADPWLIATLVVGALVMWRQRKQLRRTALLVWVAVSVVFGIKAVLYGRALQAVAADSRIESSAARMFEARWGSWSAWTAFVKAPDAVRVWRVSGRTQTVVLLFTQPIADESTLVRASRSFDSVRNFLSSHDLGFAVEVPYDSDRVEVLWSDVRYCRQDRPATAIVDCALWFGGVFGTDGRALMQVVRLGGWVQRRPPSP